MRHNADQGAIVPHPTAARYVLETTRNLFIEMGLTGITVIGTYDEDDLTTWHSLNETAMAYCKELNLPYYESPWEGARCRYIHPKGDKAGVRCNDPTSLEHGYCSHCSRRKDVLFLLSYTEPENHVRRITVKRLPDGRLLELSTGFIIYYAAGRSATDSKMIEGEECPLDETDKANASSAGLYTKK